MPSMRTLFEPSYQPSSYVSFHLRATLWTGAVYAGVDVRIDADVR